MFVTGAAFNSSCFIGLMLLLSQYQSGYTSVTWRDSHCQRLDSAFDATEAADIAGRKEGNRNEWLWQGWVRNLPSWKGHRWTATVSVVLQVFLFQQILSAFSLKLSPSSVYWMSYCLFMGVLKTPQKWVTRRPTFHCREIILWFIGGKNGAKINHLGFYYYSDKYNSKSNTKISHHVKLGLLPLAAVPLINMPKFNSLSMNFQAAEGMKRLFLGIEL